MTIITRIVGGVVVIALVIGAIVLAQYGIAPIHDPWNKNTPTQAERDVGLQQHTQLVTRQLYGQSDR